MGMTTTRSRKGGTQGFARFRHRVTCDLIIAGSRHGGLITDLSASGLYVRTKHTSQTGDRIRLVLHEEDGDVEVDARVVREHRMSRHHTTGTPSGLGVHIVAAPEAYFHLLSKLMNESSPEAG